MMREGRWRAIAERRAAAAATPDTGHRDAYRAGQVDALADVFSILNSLPPEPGSFLDAYRRIGELKAAAERRAGR